MGAARRAMLTAAVVVVVALGLGGAAEAFWSASGGTGAATTGTTAPLTLSPGTPTAGLAPGGQADVVLSVANPNPSPVTIGSLTLDPGQGTGGFAVDEGHTGCPTSTLTYTAQTNAGAGWTVPAEVGGVDGTLSIRLPGAVAMGADAASACQGATFAVYLQAGP